MSRRVAVITFHPVLNYGAVLQAYALCRVLRDMGVEVRLIDYRPETLWRWLRGFGRRPSSILWSLIRRYRYARFGREWLPLTDRVWRTAEALRREPPEADVYICGSDQIWNCRILRGLDESYFLGFVPEGSRRVAYAGSFAAVPVPAVHRDRAGELFRRFDRLSVRERFGRDEIAALCGREAVQLLDPTLLLTASDYATLAREPRRRGDYMAVYDLESTEASFRGGEQLSRLLDLPAVTLLPCAFSGKYERRHSLGPREWLGWMARAAFIYTNSFHGTAFSVILRKPFAVLRLQRPGAPQNRLDDLLEPLGLAHRMVASPDELSVHSEVLNPIDYAAVTPHLEAAVARSRAYLQEAVFSDDKG